MMNKIEIVHIVACDLNGCIGNNGELPWHLPADLKRFKELTSGGVVVMGRKTFESLNYKPLPNRVNIVITNDFQLKVDHASSKAIFYSSISAAIEKAKYEAMVLGLKEVWIIGGQSIYEQTMPYVDRIEQTLILGKYKGDTHYPSSPPVTIVSSSGSILDPATNIRYEFNSYKVNKKMTDNQEECSGSASPDFIKIDVPKGTVNLTRDNTKVKLSVSGISCMRCKKAYPINSIEYKCFTDGNCQKYRAELSGKFCTGQGRKHDSNKPRYSLLPSGTVNQVIQVLEYGASDKYEVDNWQKIPDARRRFYDAAMRHIDAWWSGEIIDIDKDGVKGSQLPHLAHAICCLLFLLWFDEQE